MSLSKLNNFFLHFVIVAVVAISVENCFHWWNQQRIEFIPPPIINFEKQTHTHTHTHSTVKKKNWKKVQCSESMSRFDFDFVTFFFSEEKRNNFKE